MPSNQRWQATLVKARQDIHSDAHLFRGRLIGDPADGTSRDPATASRESRNDEVGLDFVFIYAGEMKHIIPIVGFAIICTLAGTLGFNPAFETPSRYKASGYQGYQPPACSVGIQFDDTFDQPLLIDRKRRDMFLKSLRQAVLYANVFHFVPTAGVSWSKDRPDRLILYLSSDCQLSDKVVEQFSAIFQHRTPYLPRLSPVPRGETE